jgi:hypothetical protein
MKGFILMRIDGAKLRFILNVYNVKLKAFK